MKLKTAQVLTWAVFSCKHFISNSIIENSDFMKNIDFNHKKVLVRVDFNVPLDEDGHITDDTRIRAAIPTLKHILDSGGRIILLSHLGRPEKDKNADGSLKRHQYSLVHVVDRLKELLDSPVHFIDDTKGQGVNYAVASLQEGEVLVLENTRFYTEEKNGDQNFARGLANLADIYINDAFGAAHRAHASTATVASFFGSTSKGFGFLMSRELEAAGKLLKSPQRPFVAIIGGAKVSDKIQLIQNLLDKVDTILIGGGMAYTFIKAQGGSVGQSLVEEDKIDLAKSLLQNAQARNVNIELPLDSNCATQFSESAEGEVFNSNEIPDDQMGLDIGPKASSTYKEILVKAKTIFWNGPMGVFEFPEFAGGTLAVAEAVAEATDLGAYSLIGGGDSVAAINQSGLSERVSFISTGGGAMLTLLEGGDMPGISAIDPLLL
jgi:phosphoglycerate kinase